MRIAIYLRTNASVSRPEDILFRAKLLFFQHQDWPTMEKTEHRRKTEGRKEALLLFSLHFALASASTSASAYCFVQVPGKTPGKSIVRDCTRRTKQKQKSGVKKCGNIFTACYEHMEMEPEHLHWFQLLALGGNSNPLIKFAWPAGGSCWSWLDDMHINDTTSSSRGIRSEAVHCSLVCTNIFIKIGKVSVSPTVCLSD